MKLAPLARAATVVLAAVMVLHVLVLAGVVPFEYVGGGRYADADAAFVGEIGALLTSALFAWVSAIRGGWMRGMSPRVNRVFLWVMGGLFALNTVGNLFAETLVETLVFTPVTAFLAVAGFVTAAQPGASTKPTARVNP